MHYKHLKRQQISHSSRETKRIFPFSYEVYNSGQTTPKEGELDSYHLRGKWFCQQSQNKRARLTKILFSHVGRKRSQSRNRNCADKEGTSTSSRKCDSCGAYTSYKNPCRAWRKTCNACPCIDQTSYRATVGTAEISDEELQEVVRLHDQPSRNQKAANMSATNKWKTRGDDNRLRCIC